MGRCDSFRLPYRNRRQPRLTDPDIRRQAGAALASVLRGLIMVACGLQERPGRGSKADWPESIKRDWIWISS